MSVCAHLFFYIFLLAFFHTVLDIFFVCLVILSILFILITVLIFFLQKIFLPPPPIKIKWSLPKILPNGGDIFVDGLLRNKLFCGNKVKLVLIAKLDGRKKGLVCV